MIFDFRIRKSSTKFHIQIRKPHFKLRKALFKSGLERTRRSKNVLEFEVKKKLVGLCFEERILFKKDYTFNPVHVSPAFLIKDLRFSNK